jgi:hypothetical protein
MKYTNREIASDFKLWQEYVDPSGHFSEEDFEEMPMDERIEFIEKCFRSED